LNAAQRLRNSVWPQALHPKRIFSRLTQSATGRDRLAHKQMATLAGFAVPEVIIETNADHDYLDGMSDQDIAKFRAKAEECRLQAEHSFTVADKETWLRMAEEWIKLAQDAEQRRSSR
jgi:hypothetical protein